MRRIRRLPTPALVISVLALIVAVGGGSFAIASLNSNKVKKIAKQQANKQIKKKAPKLSVKHAKTADSATKATSATNATNATNATTATNVNGTRIDHFFATDPTSTGQHTIATLGNLTLQASCLAGGPNLLGAVNAQSNRLTYVNGDPGSAGDASLAPNTFISLSRGQQTNGGQGETNFVLHASHQNIHVEWFIRDAPGLGSGTGCFYTGTVTTG
jgi:hypothetical protein